jgi:hypothetical protein
VNINYVLLLFQGLRPTIPKHTHPMLVELLEKCWQQDPALRPDFSDIIEILQQTAKEVNSHYACITMVSRGVNPARFLSFWLKLGTRTGILSSWFWESGTGNRGTRFLVLENRKPGP